MDRKNETERTPKQCKKAIDQQVYRLNLFEHNIANAARQRDQAPRTGGSYYLDVYKRPPFLLETVSQRAAYSDELERARKLLDSMPSAVQDSLSQIRAAVNKNTAENPLSLQINGTSLDDISGMPVPLGLEDIRRIDSMIKSRPRTSSAFYVKDIVNLAATEAEAYPKTLLSSQTKPLIKRLKNYWEYYTAWALSSDQTTEFLMKMAPRNKLLWGLLTFIPARLHISPSSTYRIFDAHVENIDPAISRFLLRSLGRWGFLNNVATFLNGIPTPKGSPQTMVNYQYTDVKAEAELTKRINQSYQDRVTDSESETACLDDTTQTLVQKLSSLYHKPLRQAIQASEDRIIRVSPSTDNFFEEVLVGTLYGRTITITGLAKEGRIFVTLS
ncbi:hypothetical protein M1437_04305 [Patescibacteria group bacterium]|nr:hypothetical protein [Patescibacteria group bacterium]